MFKRLLSLAAVAAVSVPSLLFAEDAVITPEKPTLNKIVDVEGLQTDLLTTLQPWITAGLGIGLVVFAVYVGYRMIRKFTR